MMQLSYEHLRASSAKTPLFIILERTSSEVCLVNICLSVYQLNGVEEIKKSGNPKPVKKTSKDKVHPLVLLTALAADSYLDSPSL